MWGRPLLPPPAMGAVPVPNLLGKPALSPSARLILLRSTGGGLVKCVCLMLFGFPEPWISDFRHHLLLKGRQEDRPCVPQIVQSNRRTLAHDMPNRWPAAITPMLSIASDIQTPLCNNHHFQWQFELPHAHFQVLTMTFTFHHYGTWTFLKI